MFLRAEEYFRPFYAPLSVKRCVYRNINSAFSALKTSQALRHNTALGR